jgi:hypothetical protein
MSASNGAFSDRVEISWSAASGATAYRVSRSLTQQGPFAGLGDYSAGPASDMTAQPGVTYFYRVTALNGSLTSAPSDADTGYIAADFSPVVVGPGLSEEGAAEEAGGQAEPEEHTEVKPGPDPGRHVLR